MTITEKDFRNFFEALNTNDQICNTAVYNALISAHMDMTKNKKDHIEIGPAKDFRDIIICVPSERELIHISEGTGENLLEEDIAEGYVDYIYYNQYNLDGIENEEDIEHSDGGIIMRKTMLQEDYDDLKDCIPDLLKFIYEDKNKPFIVLYRQ